jgi:chorismate mutase
MSIQTSTDNAITSSDATSGSSSSGGGGGTSTSAPERTGAATPEAAELISGAREQIDVLDARILTLIRERMAVSEQIQRARITSGGRRVNLAREMEILERYRAELGRPGTRLAMLLLELCRGRV